MLGVVGVNNLLTKEFLDKMPDLLVKEVAEKSKCVSESVLDPALQSLKATVQDHFPSLWPAVDLGLATCATLLLQDNVNPVAVIYVGPPSTGKSTVLEMFGDARVSGKVFCYVSDSFTPASFVSQAANVKKEKLAEVDLLPRIQHKVLVTPELAPIFRGKEEELAKTFTVLTRVLDGQGYQCDSGTHGQRGYRGDYVFSWLGGTTPFDKKVWKVMSQLGSRLFFLLMDQEEAITLEALVHPSSSIPYAARLGECRKAVHEFLPILFEHYQGIRGVAWNPQEEDSELREWIGRCAMLLAKTRSAPLCHDSPGSEEAPWRAYAVLHNLARGHALVHGRTQLAWEDFPLIAQVTCSTMPFPMGMLFRALAQNPQGKLTRTEVQDLLAVESHNTAQMVMEEIGQSGVIKYFALGQGQASYLTFDKEWEWCGLGDYRTILSANLSKVGGCA